MNAEHDPLYGRMPLVAIGFELRHILVLNKRIIESVDIDPDSIHDIIEYTQPKLTAQFDILDSHNDKWRPTQSLQRHSTILIARLALYDQQIMALTQPALMSKQDSFTDASALTQAALPYWDSAAATNYQPEVHVLRSNRATSGVWLGISQKKT